MNKPSDTHDRRLSSLKDMPEKNNASKFGVVSCVFAEFTSGGQKITFTQQDMPYFREKMMHEILKGELIK